jgi:hypothetical protein
MTNKRLRKVIISKYKLSPLALKTFDSLSGKLEDGRIRLAHIASIHKLLSEFGIPHDYKESVNHVDNKTKGKIITINVPEEAVDLLGLDTIRLDTSENNYSHNGRNHATNIINYIRYYITKEND